MARVRSIGDVAATTPRQWKYRSIGDKLSDVAISVDELQRLAYVRYLHQLGLEQAKLADPLQSACVLMFHDAVESFLGLVCEHYGLQPPREFDKHWQELASHVPGGILPVAQGMKRLNKIRVALKHHGAQSNRSTINQVMIDTATFLSTTTQLVFFVDYESVGMESLITQPEIRALAEKAQDCKNGDKIVRAMMYITLAFDQLIEEHEPRASYGLSSSIINVGPHLGWRRVQKAAIAKLLTEHAHMNLRRDADRFVDEFIAIRSIVDRLQALALLSALGISYASHEQFRRLTPDYSGMADGSRRWQQPVGYSPTAQEFDFCLQVVVSASLRIAEASGSVLDPPWMVRNERGNLDWEDLLIEPISRRDRIAEL